MELRTVEYGEIRKQMQPGDVIAFSGKGNISEIIKWQLARVYHILV